MNDLSVQVPVEAVSGGDAQWYRDATIYQLHVKSFSDSNGDGIGDFRGLIGKLDYISDLGVDAVWLLPFYPSPRRDDGYDIADYRDVSPDYGTMDDVREFIAEAHRRGIRVITELVINHTSDQHPWFQAARNAPAGSPERDFYVWSDNDQAYAETRIIFVDSEKSNWTWDPVAGAYFWHRFFHHQPDLNFDNPAVLEEVLSVLRFWLDLGVDGLRLDAVPYLVEREGTSNENLPETHNILRKIRAAMDAHAPGKMLLAEANQWPEDTQEYFGAGDECNMAFHFPLMPRMYMAIAQEDRFPITDIMRQTPSIPDGCQWVVFLRNHDELTLEMVTDSERDYLWNTYASDRRARINLGIRRRLAPLLDHDRRRMELMTGLLFSMPGTPVIYYGDEIGMGDNTHLRDRDGVRTPMQWSPDRNGGFSRANPEALVLPVIMDPVYGYAGVNVEAQEHDQFSLLNWTRRLLAVRKAHQAFGRGSQRFLLPGNRKILAFLREHEDQVVLCVSNLSHTAQAVQLDLSSLEGRTPVDLLGGSAFPPIGQLPYQLTLPPYAFFWFILASQQELPGWYTPAPEPLPDLTTLVLRRGLADIVDPPARTLLETEILPHYLMLRRWFAAKDQRIDAIRMEPVISLGQSTGEILLVGLEVTGGGAVQSYLLPLGIVWEDETAGPLVQPLALARVRRGRKMGYLTDGFVLDSLSQTVMAQLRASRDIAFSGGTLRFTPTVRLSALEIPVDAEIRRLSAEQSNSSLLIGNFAMLKVLRRTNSGVHPEIEMSRHLTEHGYANAPALLGSVSRVGPDGDEHAMIIVQSFVQNQGDGWQWALGFLARVSDMQGGLPDEAEPTDGIEAPYLAFAAAIGLRLAELHSLLSQPSDLADFAPVEMSSADVASVGEDIGRQVTDALAALEAVHHWPDDGGGHANAALARGLVARRADLLAQVHALSKLLAGSTKIRIHGDFHLGQVLVVSGDAYLIDFEGEPARPLDQRRAKAHPLRDVAGMIRSFEYARAVAANSATSVAPRAGERREVMLEQITHDAIAAFLSAYRQAAPASDARLLDLYLLQKAAYEISYEAANRVAWLPVPLQGLAAIADRLTASDKEPTHA